MRNTKGADYDGFHRHKKSKLRDMKIIDRDKMKRLSKTDPLKRNAEKENSLENMEHSPMDPPEAYDDETSKIEDVKPEEMAEPLKKFMEEHKAATEQIESFEKALTQFKENGYKLTRDISADFNEFFRFFDNDLLSHNQKEEKALFPLLEKFLIEDGEHGNGPDQQTGIDIMEDDHIKFIQLGALTFNLLGLATRFKDARSATFTFDVAYDNGRELIELLRLHIYREDNTLFPLAQKLMNEESFKEVQERMLKFEKAAAASQESSC